MPAQKCVAISAIDIALWVIRIFDGFQNQPSTTSNQARPRVFSLPFHDNLQDNCIIVASGKGYVDAGFSPVKLSPKDPNASVVDKDALAVTASEKVVDWLPSMLSRQCLDPLVQQVSLDEPTPDA